jgi:hypothetical protein
MEGVGLSYKAFSAKVKGELRRSAHYDEVYIHGSMPFF